MFKYLHSKKALSAAGLLPPLFPAPLLMLLLLALPTRTAEEPRRSLRGEKEEEEEEEEALSKRAQGRSSESSSWTTVTAGEGWGKKNDMLLFPTFFLANKYYFCVSVRPLVSAGGVERPE